MKAVVVYESHWGNTASIAHSIAEGIGPGTRVLSTAEATPEALEGVDLLVAGAPVIAFSLPSEKAREGLRNTVDRKAPSPPDLSHPGMRSWLDTVPTGQAGVAAFDTRIRGPFGSSAPAILKRLQGLGYRPLAKPTGFLVKGTYGPLREGESERARRWGVELARSTG